MLEEIRNFLDRMNKNTEGLMNLTAIDDGDFIRVFDKNEMYSINYAYETYCMMMDFVRDFGIDNICDVEENDRIFDTLSEIANKYDTMADWESNLVIIIAKC